MYLIRYHGLYLASDVNKVFSQHAGDAQLFETESQADDAVSRLRLHASPDVDYDSPLGLRVEVEWD